MVYLLTSFSSQRLFRKDVLVALTLHQLVIINFFFSDHNPFLARVIINGMAGEKNELTI
jgi:hypothetical protein